MKKLNVVSGSFEAMIRQKFHIYAGGLAVVQAGLLKSAGRKDWSVNFYGLGILWKRGYYDQKIVSEGMAVSHTPRHYDFLEDTGVRVKVEINGKLNTIKVWRLPPEVFGTAPFFLLDTDLEENDELARSITQYLYGGNEETRLAQEIVLGIGGVRAFEALGIPVDIWHGQEGHSVLAAVEILHRHLSSGLNFEDALMATKKQFVFTTHTPELAGNESHPTDLMIRMGCFPGIPEDYVLRIGGHSSDRGRFNMTIGGFRLAKIANAVSKLHLETACQMWHGLDGFCPLISVTNGVDEDWQLPEFARADTPEDMASAKAKHKEKLFQLVERRTGKKFQEDVLTMVWARRFSGYKRPKLILTDWQWLEKLLWQDKIQIIFAGKPHPNEFEQINDFNDIYKKSLKVPNLAVLAGYEYQLSKALKAGADVWLFTSRRPREACSTSGMSAAKNGALNLASRDGWYDEIPDQYYFPYGVNYPCREDAQNAFDFQDLRRVLENEVIPTYYNDKAAWDYKTLKAKQFVKKNFSSDRMLQDYIDKMYLS